MKAYILSKWDGDYCDSGTTVGIYFNKKKLLEDIERLNEPYKSQEDQLELCEECVTCSNVNVFKLENTCKLAKISEDRNGKYCENKKDYENRESHYSYEETDILNLPVTNLDEDKLIKINISTVIKAREDITELEIEKIKEEFSEVAWANNDGIYQPKVIVERV